MTAEVVECFEMTAFSLLSSGVYLCGDTPYPPGRLAAEVMDQFRDSVHELQGDISRSHLEESHLNKGI